MKYLIEGEGFVVPFGSVTAKSPDTPAVGKYGVVTPGYEKLYQQGQRIPAGWAVISCEGETQDPAKSTAALECFFPEPDPAMSTTAMPKWKSKKGDA